MAKFFYSPSSLIQSLMLPRMPLSDLPLCPSKPWEDFWMDFLQVFCLKESSHFQPWATAQWRPQVRLPAPPGQLPASSWVSSMQRWAGGSPRRGGKPYSEQNRQHSRKTAGGGGGAGMQTEKAAAAGEESQKTKCYTEATLARGGVREEREERKAKR